MRNIEVIRKGVKKHHCKLPGPFRRWWLNLHDGAIIECSRCFTMWKLQRSYTGDMFWSVASTKKED